MLDVYAEFAENFLALPVVKGIKTPNERFAGALETFCIEAMMQDGKALQAGTSHFLGQNFAQAFDVKFADKNGGLEYVWGTSWGVSTRLLGALIMTHSDDAGLVLPPKVAPVQVVIVPIYPTKKKKSVDEEQKLDALKQSVEALAMQCREAGLRVNVDDRDYVRNGAKYFEWERKGVPLRIELGPRDYDQGVCIFKYRVGSEEKQTVQLDAAATEAVHGLNQLQQYLYESAHQRLIKGIRHGDTVSYDEMKQALTNDEASVYPGAGLFLVPWKCDETNEAKIKEECKATIRCYPLTNNTNNDVDLQGKVCFYSGEPATHMALFGRAF